MRANGSGRTSRAVPDDMPLLAISAAAELAGMHPQTLRQYDRLGLVRPKRTRGRGRRYSMQDVKRLRNVQRLSQDEGINLAGIQHILALEDDIARARRENERLRALLDSEARVFVASSSGTVMALSENEHVRLRRDKSTGLQVWRPLR